MARYKLVSEGGEWRLRPGGNLIGRAAHCLVRIDRPDVAGEHARVDLDGDRLLLADLGGDAGTFVADERVESATPLSAGSTFRVGKVTFRVKRSMDLRQIVRHPVARRIVRIGAKVALGIVVALIVLLLALPLIYNAESFKRDVIDSLEAALSRDAEIGGVDFRLLRGWTEISDVMVHNLPEFGGEPLVKAPAVLVRFHTGTYLGSLGKSLRADVTLNRPILMLERNDRGCWNVYDLCLRVVDALREAREEAVWWAPYSDLELHVRVTDATVRIRDDFAGETREITGVAFTADLPSLGGELTYSLAAEVPVAGRPGEIEATGRLTLFKDGGLSTKSVRGELLSLDVRGLDLRALPGLPHGAGGALAGAFPVEEADLDLDISAESLGSCRARVEASLRGGDTPGVPAVTLGADLSGSILPPALKRGELKASGPSWDLACLGRVIPINQSQNQGEGPPQDGAEALEVDAALHADVKLLDDLRRRMPLLSDAPLGGRIAIKLSTTGPTRELDVVADATVSGLVCRETGALPEDVSLSLRGTVGLIGWGTLDNIRVKSFVAGASFLHASVAPGEVLSIARPSGASAAVGPIEFDVDLAELGRRYGPLFAFRPPAARAHGWAEVSGDGGKLILSHAIHSRAGATSEGTTAIVFPAEGRPRAEAEWWLREPGGFSADLRGRTALAGSDPAFDLAFSASGNLSRVLEVAKPYLRPTGSLWARGRFKLENVRVSGTPSRFGTNGRLELLEPELWGGDPITPPFTESRFSAIWNLDFEMPSLPSGPVRLRANLLKGSSSALRFSLDGDVEDLGRGLGRYTLRAFADLDRIGTGLRKLALVPAGVSFSGTMNIDLSADTREGNVRLTKLELDTPFVEAAGGGEISQLPFSSLLGGRPAGKPVAPEAVSGKLRLGAKLNVDEIARLARALRLARGRDTRRAGSTEPDSAAEGEIRLDVTAEGSGQGLLVSGEINLDDFAGRLGRHVRKRAGELASLRVSASVAPGGADLVTLRSGSLALGGDGRRASFDVSGRLSGGMDRFDFAAKSESFDVSPVAALFPGILRSAEGTGRLDVRSRGRLLRGVLVPGTLELEGSVGVSGAEVRFVGTPEFRVKADGALTLAGREMSAAGLTISAKISPAGGIGPFMDLGTIGLKKLDLALRAAPPGISVVFDAASSNIDIGALVAAVGSDSSRGSVPRRGEQRRAIPRWLSLQGRLAADHATVWPGRAVMEKLDCGVMFDGGCFRFTDAVARVWGGLLSGEGLVDLTGARPRVRGSLALNEVDLVEAAKAAGIPGALKGMGGGSLKFEGEGLGRLDFERSWRLDIEGRTAEVTLATARWPLAREVRAALERVLGVSPSRPLGQTEPRNEPDLRGRATTARSKPVALKVAVRRGRTSMESTDFEFEDGLRLAISGRTELDGRIAAWVTVRRLPKDTGNLSGGRAAIVEELVRRGAFRFAVTGTWARPVVDVEGLLRWILPDARGDSQPGDTPGEGDAD